MKWSIVKARQRFAQLIDAAASEPQPIYRRDKLVAAVVDAETYRQYQAWLAAGKQQSIGTAFKELRQLCQEEDYQLELPARQDRPNPATRGIQDCGISLLNPFL